MPSMHPCPPEGSAPLRLRRACAAAAALLLAALATQAQASRSEYLSWFDTDGDERVSLAEYQNYLSQGFHAMDRNGDGVLSASEMPTGVRLRTATTLESRQRALTRMFDRLDVNNDGYLDAYELTAMP
jgi:hypothetical protein